jgi:hypothetical protein
VLVVDLIIEFIQGDAIRGEVFRQFNLAHPNEQIGGLCFRLAFKWAACHAAGGGFQFDEFNVGKTASKHLDYRRNSQANEKSEDFDFRLGRNIKAYVVNDQTFAMYYLAKWGKHFKDKFKAELSVTLGETRAEDIAIYLNSNPINNIQGLVYGFYGRTVNGKEPRGHAVALSGGQYPFFFDPNMGMYRFNSAESVSGNTIGQAILAHIRSKYGDWVKEFFFVMPLTSP